MLGCCETQVYLQTSASCHCEHISIMMLAYTAVPKHSLTELLAWLSTLRVSVCFQPKVFIFEPPFQCDNGVRRGVFLKLINSFARSDNTWYKLVLPCLSDSYYYFPIFFFTKSLCGPCSVSHYALGEESSHYKASSSFFLITSHLLSDYCLILWVFTKHSCPPSSFSYFQKIKIHFPSLRFSSLYSFRLHLLWLQDEKRSHCRLFTNTNSILCRRPATPHGGHSGHNTHITEVGNDYCANSVIKDRQISGFSLCCWG